MNTCEEIREALLEFGWNEADRQRAREVLGHLQNCPLCAEAALTYDEVRGALAESGAEASDAQIEAMQQRMMVELGAADFSQRRRWRIGIRAVAASVVLGILGFGIGRWQAGGIAMPSANDHGVAADASNEVAFSQPDIARQAAAFQKVANVFDHRASWLLVGDRDSDMGLTANPIGASNRVLLLRLAMLHAGRVISKSDLAIVAGQSAELNLQLADRKTLHYEIGTSQDDPGQLMIGSQLMADGSGETVAALATILKFEPGESQSAGTVATTSGKYELRIAFGSSGDQLESTQP